MKRETLPKDCPQGSVTRRTLLKSGAFVGGTALALGGMPWLRSRSLAGATAQGSDPYPLADAENLIYTTCLNCHVACPIKAKFTDGVLSKVAGSPYSPQNLLPHIPLETSPLAAALVDGKLCAKGQSSVQTYYDPYRLRKVIKRAGPRGSNKWETIPWSQFITEVTEGGQIFSGLGETQEVAGFRQVAAVRDNAEAAALKAAAGKFAKGELTLGEFRSAHPGSEALLADPDHPDLGPRNNGFVALIGRAEHGRKELLKWFTKALGSPNYIAHTSICELSHHVAYSEMSSGATSHLKPDLLNCDFVMFWGTGAFEANFGFTVMAEKVTKGLVERGMKIAVLDPRLSKTAGKADWWVPIKPGGDVHFAMGMIRWMLENNRYDAAYLANANQGAAKQSGETTSTDSTHLVLVEDGRPTRYLSGADLGLAGDGHVALQGGTPAVIGDDSMTADLFGEIPVTVAGKAQTAKTVLTLWREQAMAKPLADWAKDAGSTVEMVSRLASEFTSHGKRAAVEFYRGPVQHTNGLWAAQAIIALNLFIGNPDWKGGLAPGGSHWHEFGGKPGNIHDFKAAEKALPATWGPKISREKAKYEDTSLFRERGYTAERPWYPFSFDIYQEVIPSAKAQYPYGCEILLLHKGTPALATPGGQAFISTLQDTSAIPLFIACDIVIAETSMYADYIIPDLTYMERWGTPHVTPDVASITSKIRQPAAVPLTEDVTVDGESMPISVEAFMLAVGKALGLHGFGNDAIGAGVHFNSPEDWYLTAISNIAAGDKVGEVCPEADDAELALFRRARRHLPPSVFDEARWRRAFGDDETLWRRVVYLLNRGGRYAPAAWGWDGDKMKKRFGKPFNLFLPKVASARNAMNGSPFPAIPVANDPIAMDVTDALGRPVSGGAHSLVLFTYKEAFGGHSRTISNYWSNVSLQPENPVLMAKRDATAMGIATGDAVRLVSTALPSGEFSLGDGRTKAMVGKAKVVEGLRPGTVGVSWHYGHWAYGSNDVVMDGQTIPGDRRRAAGLCPNHLMLMDPALGDVCLTDPIGASASFFDSTVTVQKV